MITYGCIWRIFLPEMTHWWPSFKQRLNGSVSAFFLHLTMNFLQRAQARGLKMISEMTLLATQRVINLISSEVAYSQPWSGIWLTDRTFCRLGKTPFWSKKLNRAVSRRFRCVDCVTINKFWFWYPKAAEVSKRNKDLVWKALINQLEAEGNTSCIGFEHYWYQFSCVAMHATCLNLVIFVTKKYIGSLHSKNSLK